MSMKNYRRTYYLLSFLFVPFMITDVSVIISKQIALQLDEKLGFIGGAGAVATEAE